MPALESARFYAILDAAYVPRTRWRETASALIAGGADLVQVRAKQASPAERAALVAEVLPLFQSSSETGLRPHLIINDDVELCARTPGAGLHLGQDDTPPEVARQRIGPDRLVGLSTHSWSQAQVAMGLPAGVLSYFCVGPLFATKTKPDYVPVGLDLVRQVARAQPSLPWFTIGGINRTNVRDVLAAGSPRIVVVSDVLLAADPAAAVRELRQAVAASVI